MTKPHAFPGPFARVFSHGTHADVHAVSRRRAPWRSALTCALGAGLWALAALATAATPTLTLVLHPAAADAQGAVPSVDVALEVQDLSVGKGATLLKIDKVANSTVTSAEQLSDLRAEDAAGPIRLTAEDSAASPSDQVRRWHADRAVAGTLKLRYRVALDAAAPPSGGPIFEMRTGEGAFSGAGLAFLVLPEDEVARTVRLRWELPPGGEKTTAVSSLGVGDAVSARPLTVGELGDTYFMQGRTGLYQSRDGQFVGTWTGTPQFPIDQVMRWAASLHTFYATFFLSTGTHFGIFTRPNPFNPGSGIGLTDSFAFTYGLPTTEQGTRLLLAHEMFHSFMVSLRDDDPGSVKNAWFSEGLAVYYQRALPLRAGLIDGTTFLNDLNRSAAQYYTNSARDGSNAEVAQKFWSDPRLRLLPYNRGSLYFAQVDAAIRARSAGKRSLDDVVRALVAAQRAGQTVDEALWRTLLRAELGKQGIADYEAMLAGALVLPPSDAFGPCFRRVVRKTRPFDPGFAMSAFAAPRKVMGLVPGSEADKAGIRDGDTLVKGSPGDGTLSDPDKTMTLNVRRGEQTFEVTYLPRGAPVDTYQWEQTGAPQCVAGR